jgi:hypothetical protein
MCFGRKQVWKGNLQQLQKEISIVSRVIIHPKYRNIGLGEKLVRDTLLFAGTPYVEAVAVMAKYNPFFEKAGMQKIAESKPSKPVTNALAELEALGFDRALMGSATYNQQKLAQTGNQPISDILTELSAHDGGVRRRLVNTPNPYPKHQEFKEKIANYTTTELAEALKSLSFAAQTKIYLFWTKNQAQSNKASYRLISGADNPDKFKNGEQK